MEGSSMNWISLITTLIIFIAWMFAMHKWKETERKLEIKGTEISNLKRDVEYWRELAKLRSIELNTTRMKAENEWANEYEVEYQTDTTGKYIIEVNQGVYLRKSIITTFRNVEVVYNFTDDFEKLVSLKMLKNVKR